MKYNLNHFLAKRKLTFQEFLKENNVTNFSEYEELLAREQFIDFEGSKAFFSEPVEPSVSTEPVVLAEQPLEEPLEAPPKVEKKKRKTNTEN